LRLPVGRSSDFIMHIYSCDQWILKGSVSHVQSGRSMVFHSMMEMVLAVQDKMDEIGFPQSTTAPRGWKRRPAGADQHIIQHSMGARSDEDVMPEAILASFLVRIQFRQNASWQGTLVWMDSKESCAFRSLLELVKLVADAMRICQVQAMETETPLTARTWMIEDRIS